MSAFGFLSPKTDESKEEPKSVESGGEEKPASSFSFLGKKSSSASAPSPPTVPIVAPQISLDQTDIRTSQKEGDTNGSGGGAIKLEKAASSGRTVKKKKKVAGNRVGFDRSSAIDTPDNNATVTSPVLQNNSTANLTEDENADTPGPPISTPPRPPPPLPSQSSPPSISILEELKGERDEVAFGDAGDASRQGKAVSTSGADEQHEVQQRREEGESACVDDGEAEKAIEEAVQGEEEEEEAEEKAEGVSAISQKSEDDCDQIGSLQQTPSTEAELWKPGTFMDPAHSSLVSKEFGRLRDEVKKCIRKIGNLSVKKREHEVTKSQKQKRAKELGEEVSAMGIQQEELAEAEDYEKAHDLSLKTETSKVELEAIEDSVVQLSEEGDQMDRELAEVRTQAISLIADGVSTLQEIQALISKGYDNTIHSAEDAHNQLQQKQSEGEKRIAELEELLEEKEGAVQQQEEEVMNKVKSEAVDVFDEREELLVQVAPLEEEIVALEQALSAKKASLSSVRTRIQKCDDAIEVVKDKYRAEFDASEAIRKAWIEESCNMDIEVRKLKEYNTAISEEIESFTVESFYFTEKLSNFKSEVELMVRLSDRMTDSGTSSDSKATGVHLLQHTPSDVASAAQPELIASLEKVHTALQDLHAQRSELDGELEYLDGEDKILSEQAEKLNTDKKKFAAAKKFKEASDVAKEQQLVLAERKDVEDKISTVHERMEQVRQEHSKLIADQKRLRDALAAARKTADEGYLEQLKGRRALLMAFLDETKALEEGDDDANDANDANDDEFRPTDSPAHEFSLCMPLVAAELACLDSEESLFSLRYPAHSSEEGKVDEKCDVE